MPMKVYPRVTTFGVCLLICLPGDLLAEATSPESFANFESPQARSLTILADASRLYAVNTPAGSLSVYSLEDPQAPELTMEIPVGLEPVAVAEHTENEVWVVNHISDSISVVDTSIGAVVDTIQVGDRPGDLAFAGDPKLAFVTSMTDRSVRVIDPRTRQQIRSIPIEGNDPRTLLPSADGKTVWVALYRSGNRTTIIPHNVAPNPPKPTNEALPPAPRQGIIVDSEDPEWKGQLKVALPDHDIFEIDVADLSVRRRYQGIGTNLFNLAQRPGTNELWVANTHARNLVRFEPELRGHVIDSQLTRIATGNSPSVTLSDLNPDIDYATLPNSTALATALSEPTDIIFNPSGNRAYVAAFGTDRIGVVDTGGKVTARIEIGDAEGDSVEPQSKRGPRSMAHHPEQELLYVLNRLSNSLSVINTATRKVLTEIDMVDPTPKLIRQGRGYLFDAKLSGNGTLSCASCHIDGDRDGLAWDLGNPSGELFHNGSKSPVHPMKGPLLTQTLRGLDGERLFHWRADRPGLESFNSTFVSLMGGELLDDDDLDLLVGYMKSIRFAPNPNRNRDDSLPMEAKDGEELFLTKNNVGREGNNRFRCVDCHVNATGSGGFGFTSLIEQPTKVAQLRGLHERDGRFAGFRYGADGSKADLIDFLAESHRFDTLNQHERESLQRFLFSFPTETAPIVGFTRTVTAANATQNDTKSDLHLLVAQGKLRNCDLSVTGLLAGDQVRFAYDPSDDVFTRQDTGGATMTLGQLLTRVMEEPNAALTFIGQPCRRP